MTTERLTQLRENLIEYFDLEELRTLCFDLGVDYDGLRGEGKESKARELLSYLERRGRVRRLIEQCNKLRSNVVWQEILNAVEAESPFKGLEYFDVTDADLFFGRELLTADLVSRLRQDRFLAVVGASGSGKSSVARAGLVAALRRGEELTDDKGRPVPPLEGSRQWPIHVITPTAHPLKELAASLTRDSESVTATTTLMDDLTRDPRSLDLAVSKLLKQSSKGNRLLLVVDQFEELFTVCKEESERKSFVDNLLHAAEPETAGQTIVVIALRADFYAHCAQYANLRDALEKHQAYIGPMTADELRRAIEEPARLNGLEFEPGLVDLVLRDVGANRPDQVEPGALPLLSHALLETWKRRQGRTLTLAGYADCGGVRGAIARTADDVYNRLTPDQQLFARNIFMRLTELGEGTQHTRRRAALTELIPHEQDKPAIEVVVKVLADARLVTTEKDMAEVAHEALIREWPALRTWLDEDRERLRIRRDLTQATQDWVGHTKDASYLYRGTRLAQAVEIFEVSKTSKAYGALNALEREFLNASQELAGHEAAEREAQWQRELEAAQTLAKAERQRAEEQSNFAVRLRQLALFLAGVSVIAALLGIAAGVFGFRSVGLATRNAEIASTAQAGERAAEQAEALALSEQSLAQSRQIAAVARSEIDQGNTERALLLAIASYRITDTVEAKDMLYQALSMWRGRDIMQNHEHGVTKCAISPDGQAVATVTGEFVHLWEIKTRRTLILRGHTDFIMDMKFSPDGKFVATASQDGTGRLWDLEDGHEIWRSNYDGGVITLAFSPDGQYLAFGGLDKQITIWRVKTHDRFTVLTHDSWGYPIRVSFSPDSQLVAAAYSDSFGRVWNMQNITQTMILAGHRNVVRDIAFSPDSKTIVTFSDDNTLRLWKAKTGVQIASSEGYVGLMGEMEFSPDGRYVAAASFGGVVYLWDVRRPSEGPIILSGHTDAVPSLSFSPDARFLATASWDGTARLWSVETKEPLLVFSGHTKKLWKVVYSPTGQYIVTTSEDGTARLWDVRNGSEIATRSYTSAVLAAAYSPDGRSLILIEGNTTHLLWLDTNVEKTIPLTGTDIQVAATSPNGSLVAVSDNSGATYLWKLGTEKQSLISSRNGIETCALAFDPEGRNLAIGSRDGSIRVWNVQTESEIADLAGHENDACAVTFSPDGYYLATGSGDKTVRIWNWQKGEAQAILRAHNTTVRVVVFSRDGQRIVTIDHYGEIRIWSFSQGTAVLETSLHSDSPIRSAAFSPDGELLATGDEHGNVLLWDWRTGEAIHLRGHRRQVDSIGFHPNGQYIVTGGQDGTLRVWPVNIQDAIAMGCTRVSHDLSEQDWQRYVPGVKYSATCPTAASPDWVEAERLSTPNIPVRVDNFPAKSDKPVIYYFEAIPGTRVAAGESVVLRWDLENAQSAFLLYEDRQDGITAPNEIVVSPSRTTTYRLVATNEFGQVEKWLTIIVKASQ